MSVKPFVKVEGKGLHRGDIMGYWDLTPGDTAAPLLCPRYSDKSVHIFGTFGGATVAMEASNDPALSNFGEAYDPEGTYISQTADRTPWVILPNVYALRPTITGGSGSAVRIVILGRGDNR